MTTIRTAGNTILMLVFAIDAVAQTSPANRLDIAQRMKRNGEILEHYSYKRRTEVVVNGQPRGARVDLVRYVNGTKETISLETPQRTEQPGGARGLRGKLAQRKVEKKKEEMRAEMEQLKNAVTSYLSPDSDSMRAVLQNATISRTGSGPDAEIKLTASGMKDPSDSFTMIWSTAKHQPVSIEVRTESDGKPVQFTDNYATLPDGAFYTATTVISAPKTNIGLTITNYDYVRSTESAEAMDTLTSGQQ